MQTTGNLGLKKPEGTDIVDIADLNGNMDILDNAVNGKVDKVTGKQLSTNDYTAAEKTKLAGIATGATNYTHPATHPPTIIAQDSSNRFVTDAEKTAWNAKAGTAVATTSTNGLMSAVDKTLLNNNTGFGTTAGAATAYTLTLSPAPTALIAGLKFSFKTHIDSGANPTLNPNTLGAKAIKKPNGNAAILTLNGVYTVVYDGTAFILQGEGGEYGTATAAQVLAPYTVGQDNGLVTGTIPTAAAGAAPAKVVGYNGNLDVTPVKAYNDGTTVINIKDTNYNTANWLRGKSIFGVDGAIPDFSSAPASGYKAAKSAKGDWSGSLVLEPETGYYKSGLNSGGFGAIIASDPNFVPSNILQGKTIFGVDGAIVQQPASASSVSTTWDGINLWVRIPRGAYLNNGGTGIPEIVVNAAQARADSNIIASNIRNGTWVYGVQGTLQPKQFASGSLVTGGVVNVSGLGFRPTGIAMKHNPDSGLGWSSMFIYYLDPVIGMGIQAMYIMGQDVPLIISFYEGSFSVDKQYSPNTMPYQEYVWAAWN
ncbi:hypothetical protein [Paenibacillus odorifer]|uniref:Uncharacterized protein n=1 Tax=Paenibacillus odorifer TaxID=189426 RepID=A0AAD0KMJ1_9BACL|nr:hypothetical protein [Paenibacillus odorifer]AWV35934.1 hypothetical protein CD191_26810 [Paenibacillus odorifer]